MNVYRSIGGRANASGTERVNRDGKIEVVNLGDAEVTPRDRMRWYSKAKIDQRGRLPEDIFDVDQSPGGNDMKVDVKNRTRQPRPHQYSVESRLQAQRGEKVEFPKSTKNRDNAVGIMSGAVLPDRGCEQREEKKASTSMAPAKVRFASAFEKIAGSITGDGVSPAVLASVSAETGLSVEDVCMLERIALRNDELVEKYAGIRDPERRQRHLKRLQKRRKTCPRSIPGNEDAPGDLLEKSSDDEETTDQEKLNATALEVGLVE